LLASLLENTLINNKLAATRLTNSMEGMGGSLHVGIHYLYLLDAAINSHVRIRKLFIMLKMYGLISYLARNRFGYSQRSQYNGYEMFQKHPVCCRMCRRSESGYCAGGKQSSQTGFFG
jgi:hypothetical protein